jgi:hypothetical protein
MCQLESGNRSALPQWQLQMLPPGLLNGVVDGAMRVVDGVLQLVWAICEKVSILKFSVSPGKHSSGTCIVH